MTMENVQEAIAWLQQYDIIGAIIIIVAAFIIGEIAKLIINRAAKHIAKRTETSLDDHILHAVGKPVLWGITLAGVFVALLSMKILASRDAMILRAAEITGIIWGVWLLMRIIRALFRWYAEEMAGRTKSDLDDKYLHIFRRVINIILVAVAGMIILRELGIEITPLIASLGIGGLAIALALQDTIANFFSGFYIISERAIKIGDYIELEGGQLEGHVVDIGWRTSKIKTLANNYIILPNSKFSTSVVTNYQAPTPEMSVIIPVGVAYDSDLEKVERVTIETAAETQKEVDGGVKDFMPLIRYKEFADSSINFIAVLRVGHPVAKGMIRHEFIKRLTKRYRKEGIEIPFPIRTVYLKK